MIAEPEGDKDPVKTRDITLADAIDALERMGLLNVVEPGTEESYPACGITIKHEGDTPMRVAFFTGR